MNPKFGIKLVLSLVACLFIFPATSFAYLDPGSAGFLLQLLVAGLAATMLFFKSFWLKVKRLFSIIFGWRAKKEHSKDSSTPH